MRSSRTSFAPGVLALCAVTGCKDPDPPKPAAVLAAAPSASVDALATFTVPAGTTSEGVWVPEFAVRPEIESGQDYLDAAERCGNVSLALCTEVQWTRACATEARIGSIEAWTASVDGDRGFIVRGGGGCDARAIAKGSEVSPTRRAVCCSRAVAIASSNKNATFLASTSGKLLTFETAVRKADNSGLRALLADPTNFYGASRTGESVASTFQALSMKHPGLWVIHDTCDVTMQKEEGTWTADCRKIAQQDGQIAAVITRYVWSAEGKITSITDPKVMRAFTAP